MDFPSTPSPPFPPPTLTTTSASTATTSLFSSLTIIAGILTVVLFASILIHLLLRYFSSRSSSSSPPLINQNTSNSTNAPLTTTSSATAPSLQTTRSQEQKSLIESLPRFIFATSTPSSECAVCLSRFRNGDELRLIPTCRHTFHATCIADWLRSPAVSCPLCRSPVHLPYVGVPRSTHNEQITETQLQTSLGHTPTPPPPPPTPPTPSTQPSPPRKSAGTSTAADTIQEQQSMSGGEGRGGWLKDYIDRFVSSASSSLSSSFRFSGRWSQRFDGAAVASSFDLEEGGGESSIYRKSATDGTVVN